MAMNLIGCVRRSPVIALLAGLSMAPATAFAQDVEHRPWSELVVVVGHSVALPLPDGYIEGRAMAVTNEAIDIDVDKTSNLGAYQKGPITIPRGKVSVIRLRRSDNRAPRVASQVIGQAAIMGGIFGFASRPGVRGSLRGAGIQIAAATAGAVVGRRLDNRHVETVIRITPEPDSVVSGPPDRRQTCGTEPDGSNDSITNARVRPARDRSQINVDEYDSDYRRAAGSSVPRCGNR